MKYAKQKIIPMQKALPSLYIQNLKIMLLIVGYIQSNLNERIRFSNSDKCLYTNT